ncbi:hypothetical protein KHQ81_14930 [Mycoplasmatota bacterium]|nr:hypothetical protein KHQ81_14930 [Mycoplasmatota bacterium]
MDVLHEFQKWYNNSDAVSNTVQILNLLIIIIFIWVISWLKKKARKLLANDKQKVPEEKMDMLIENQVKNNRALQNVNQMIMLFSLNTNIKDGTKTDIINLYNDIKNNAIDLTNKSKQLIESTVDQAKEIVDTAVENVEEVKIETKSIMDKYRKELKEDE